MGADNMATSFWLLIGSASATISILASAAITIYYSQLKDIEREMSVYALKHPASCRIFLWTIDCLIFILIPLLMAATLFSSYLETVPIFFSFVLGGSFWRFGKTISLKEKPKVYFPNLFVIIAIVLSGTLVTEILGHYTFLDLSTTNRLAKTVALICFGIGFTSGICLLIYAGDKNKVEFFTSKEFQEILTKEKRKMDDQKSTLTNSYNCIRDWFCENESQIKILPNARIEQRRNDFFSRHEEIKRKYDSNIAIFVPKGRVSYGELLMFGKNYDRLMKDMRELDEDLKSEKKNTEDKINKPSSN